MKPEEKQWGDALNIVSLEEKLQNEREHLNSLKTLQLAFEKAKSDILKRELIIKQKNDLETRIKELRIGISIDTEINSLKQKITKLSKTNNFSNRFKIVEICSKILK